LDLCDKLTPILFIKGFSYLRKEVETFVPEDLLMHSAVGTLAIEVIIFETSLHLAGDEVSPLGYILSEEQVFHGGYLLAGRAPQVFECYFAVFIRIKPLK
jgi:hypothetical protein